MVVNAAAFAWEVGVVEIRPRTFRSLLSLNSIFKRKKTALSLAFSPFQIKTHSD